MKHIKSFNESIKDVLKSKSKDDILKDIDKMNTKDKLKNACKYNIIWLVEDILKDNTFDPSFDNNECLMIAKKFKLNEILDILIKNEKVIDKLIKYRYNDWVDSDYNVDELEYEDEGENIHYDNDTQQYYSDRTQSLINRLRRLR